jgi:transposase
MAKKPKKRRITGGVDTHKDTHHAAVVLMNGRRLADAQFPATAAGYAGLLAWMRGFGRLHAIGVEGTGSYGAALARYLSGQDVRVVEVNRPDRRQRRAKGKITDLDTQLAALVNQARPDLLQITGVGVETAAQLLSTCGDNPDRLSSDAAFASLCGVSPIPASSGKTNRHRLNRGGDRQANRALYLIAISRMAHNPRTRTYVNRRTTEGLSKKEIIRCLKRYIARELYKILTHPKTQTMQTKDLAKAA